MFSGTPVEKIMDEFYENLNYSLNDTKSTDNQVYDFIVGMHFYSAELFVCSW